MPTTIQDLLQTVDDARSVATDLGARLYRVFVRVRTWAGATQGDGAYADVDTEILPRPRLRMQMVDGEFNPLDDVNTAAGDHVQGIIKVDKISAQIALATLRPALAENQRQYFVLQGADGGEVAPILYVANGPPIRKTTEWTLQLLKVQG
jgi:hypothetical protein